MIAGAVVPSLGGAAGALAALAAAAVAATVGVAVVGRARRPERIAAALVCGAVTFLALRSLPSLAGTRRSQWAVQHGFGEATSILSVENEYAVEPAFLRYLDLHLPRDATFSFVTGPKITTSAAASWAQWVLLPRAENSGRACAAGWIVFFDHPAALAGVRIRLEGTFRPGYSYAQVTRPCT